MDYSDFHCKSAFSANTNASGYVACEGCIQCRGTRMKPAVPSKDGGNYVNLHGFELTRAYGGDLHQTRALKSLTDIESYVAQREFEGVCSATASVHWDTLYLSMVYKMCDGTYTTSYEAKVRYNCANVRRPIRGTAHACEHAVVALRECRSDALLTRSVAHTTTSH